MMPVFWVIAFVVLIGIEVLTMALTTVWFAGGALAAFILALLGAGVEAQLIVFVIVSFILLFFTRPFVAKYINKKTTKTNSESLIGRHARITALVDNERSTGAAVVNGQEWTARAFDDSKIYAPDETVVIREIRGVKLIVSSVEEEI